MLLFLNSCHKIKKLFSLGKSNNRLIQNTIENEKENHTMKYINSQMVQYIFCPVLSLIFLLYQFMFLHCFVLANGFGTGNLVRVLQLPFYKESIWPLGWRNVHPRTVFSIQQSQNRSSVHMLRRLYSSYIEKCRRQIDIQNDLIYTVEIKAFRKQCCKFFDANLNTNKSKQ